MAGQGGQEAKDGEIKALSLALLGKAMTYEQGTPKSQ